MDQHWPQGALYIVPTPLGNLSDMTLRAVEALKQADLIACEDTRRTLRLLNHLGISKPLWSYHAHSSPRRASELIRELEGNKRVAIVSDAGTPGLSDPGTPLVQAAIQANIPVISLPGPCAAITALVGSGLPTDRFFFIGFLPRRPARAKRALESAVAAGGTVVLYESPYRTVETIRWVEAIAGPEIPVVVARELTKIHEEFLRGSAKDVRERLEAKPPIGEVVIMFGKKGRLMIRVSIVGATGYTGGELLRYLVRHPEVSITHLTSESYAGQPVYNIHKFLRGRSRHILEKLNVAALAQDSDVAFLGLPHGAAAKTAAQLLKKGVKVIDLSADFRIRDLKVYEKWYGKHPAGALMKEAVYGLPERYRDEIRNAKLVANPGCYATTAILAGLPLVTAGLLGSGPVIVDAKSGVSGAGRKVEAMYLYSELDESMQAYALKGHRHEPEIYQEWNRARKISNEFIFVPQLAPMNRGIFANLYAPLKRKMTAEAVREAYLSFYMREPFVSILGTYESPEIKAVTYTNLCQIGISVSASGKQAIITAALDNLVKGASGQAIQNMNLMFGLDETTGLL